MLFRSDKFITNNIDSLTRSYIQKMIAGKKCFVNGKAVKASCRVKDGDEVAFSLPESVEPDIAAENIPLDILYEDSDVLIVNKPKHMVVHPAPGPKNPSGNISTGFVGKKRTDDFIVSHPHLPYNSASAVSSVLH